jgi:putative FmdB family regulatory protein
MPFYEYQCNSCGHTLEAMQKITEAPLKKCPHCGKPQLQRLMSAPVFPLEGRRLVRDGFQVGPGQQAQSRRPTRCDAPKDDKKDKTEASGSKEASISSDAAKPEKSADKPADKAADKAQDPGKKAVPSPAAGAATATSRRAAGSGSNKGNARKAVKRPARPAAKRSAAKPARRR